LARELAGFVWAIGQQVHPCGRPGLVPSTVRADQPASHSNGRRGQNPGEREPTSWLAGSTSAWQETSRAAPFEENFTRLSERNIDGYISLGREGKSAKQISRCETNLAGPPVADHFKNLMATSV